ncbi:MAG: alpha-ketoglutarate-dependent dioxygenase AlkB [Bdellovibrionales bacterium CG12_big_fil_rev_8_21_14_0_65_38_15]|nr:MAG: alpha-ketoglutarate-dependent dioxygenase AlkB [Bdellovibrionales bacterium CG22_combo_CG10-13_8_21_14_all_38_13]PIQ56898.1 MAG: alpha-ketoglutarate-dependent dioxygenase AlkB [Bdellovibrionales bacterium CG12_big_fil_rev_8_21_14_0_65_38_15]PIR30063.1 MAG: alpha-ketoglutarate-dependent dioxygenase AlkB [Bdellovibrionales bacterium CG11_big_fil_rev_8_21_14_0_20_38_13]
MSWMKQNLLPFEGEVYLLENAFKEEQLSPLIGELAWRQDQITLWGKTHPVPRLQAWYADDGLSYTYSKIVMEAGPWNEKLLEIKNEVITLTGHHFNSVLCNLYRSGADKNGWHRDNEPELGVNPVIASVSFGAVRKFSLRHRTTKRKIDIELPSCSLLLMRGESQHAWEHQLAATKKVISSRLNLTFRYRKSDDTPEL